MTLCRNLKFDILALTGRSIAEDDRISTENILMNMRDRRWSWLGHVLGMDEDRLVRKVFLNCAQPTKESLYGDIPDLGVEKAIEIAQDREKWKKIRPSQRCIPLYGDIANKEEEEKCPFRVS